MKKVIYLFFALVKPLIRLLNPPCVRRVIKHEDCVLFSNIYEKKSGYGVPVGYLQQANTFIFYKYNQPTQWLGGVSLNSTPNFRIFSSFSLEEKEALLNTKNISEKSLLEISAFWMNSFAVSACCRIMIYIFFVLKAYTSKKKTIVCGSSQVGLQKMYQLVFHNILYTNNIIIEGKVALIKSFYVDRTHFLLNFLKLVLKGGNLVFKKHKSSLKVLQLNKTITSQAA